MKYLVHTILFVPTVVYNMEDVIQFIFHSNPEYPVEDYYAQIQEDGGIWVYPNKDAVENGAPIAAYQAIP